MFGDTRRIYFQLIEQSDIENYTMLLNLRNRNPAHIAYDHIYPKIEFKDWEKETNNEIIDSSTMNRLILESFLKNGMKETAVIFAKESGIDLNQTLQIKVKNIFEKIYDFLMSNKIDDLCECLKKIDNDFLFKNKVLYLKIKFFKLSQNESFENLQKIIFEEILTIFEDTVDEIELEENIDCFEIYLSEFLLKKKLDHKKKEVFEEIKVIIQKYYRLNGKDSLNHLIKMVYHLQSEIGKDSKIPFLVDKKFTKKTKLFNHHDI